MSYAGSLMSKARPGTLAGTEPSTSLTMNTLASTTMLLSGAMSVSSLLISGPSCKVESKRRDRFFSQGVKALWSGVACSQWSPCDMYEPLLSCATACRHALHGCAEWHIMSEEGAVR